MSYIVWIVRALEIFLGFFGKILFWIESRIGLDLVVASLVKIRSVTYFALLALFFTLALALVTSVVSFVYFSFEAVMTVYDMVNSLIVTSNDLGNSNSPVVHSALYLLQVSGVMNAINASMPFILSALLFRLIKVIYITMIKMLKIFAWLYKTAWELSRQATDTEILHPQISRTVPKSLPSSS